MDLHGKVEGHVSALLVKEGMFVCGVSQPFVSVRSYQHSGGVVVAVTRMPDTACFDRNSTLLLTVICSCRGVQSGRLVRSPT